MASIAIIGSGIGSLSAASLLARDGHQVTVLEQNYLPGGCASSYYRQGFIFESGATTLVGLDEHMPLKHLLDTIGLRLDLLELSPSMAIHLPDGRRLIRHKNLQDWIQQAESAFGVEGQRPFWELCYDISSFVWRASLGQTSFPPRSFSDLWGLAKNFRWEQLRYARWAFYPMNKLLKRFGLDKNPTFVRFVDEQLLITAQNRCAEVNVLFGATALCYTNFSNYYLWGGMIRLAEPLCEYIRQQGGQVRLKTGVEQISPLAEGYELLLSDGSRLRSDLLLSGIPINNTVKLWKDESLQARFQKNILPSKLLNSAFQMGIGFKRSSWQDNIPLHSQIHLPQPLVHIGAHSIFLSLSHPDDFTRAPLGQGVGSISCHIADPEKAADYDKEEVERAILSTLEQQRLVPSSDIIYKHSSNQSSWQRWTKREWGFVGGYPQLMSVKPWQMLDARLDKRGAYICGDTVYPGQGVVGVCLSGILAYEKMKADGVLAKKQG